MVIHFFWAMLFLKNSQIAFFFRSRTWCKMTFDTYNIVESENFGRFKKPLHQLSSNYELQITIWSKMDFFPFPHFQLWVRFRHHFFNVNHFLDTIHSKFIWSNQHLKAFFTWKWSSVCISRSHPYISWFSLRTQKFVLSMFSSISPITPNSPPLPITFFKKIRERVVGEFFLLAQKIFAYGELEITPTKSAPAAGI